MVQHQCGNMRWQYRGAPSKSTSGKRIKMGDNWKSHDRVRTNPLFITKKLVTEKIKSGKVIVARNFVFLGCRQS